MMAWNTDGHIVGSLLPAPVWRVNVKDIIIQEEWADAWGFYYFPPNDYQFDGLLCCKSRVPYTDLVAHCEPISKGLFHGFPVQLTEADNSQLHELDTVWVEEVRQPQEEHCHIQDGWVVVCDGINVRRIAWLPKDNHYLKVVLIKLCPREDYILLRLES